MTMLLQKYLFHNKKLDPCAYVRNICFPYTIQNYDIGISPFPKPWHEAVVEIHDSIIKPSF